MLPEWMSEKEEYEPSKGGNPFAAATIGAIAGALSRIKVQKGHEKGRALPPLFKLFVTLALILLVSLATNRLIVMAVAAPVLLYLCTWPARDIAGIVRTGLGAAIFTFIILIPAIIMNRGLLLNEIFIVAKVFLCVVILSIFNHTTQWNHITGAMRTLHIPGIFIFILDITLKYIVLLGNLIMDILTAYRLRSVGKNNKKHQSVGGVMGVTFIRGAEMNRQMYEAMQCRGFTDDYKGL